MAEPATVTEVERLDQLDDDAFQRLVETNIDTATGDKQLWVALCHPVLVDRTAGCLDEMVEKLERHITTRMLGAGHHKVKVLNAVNTRVRQVNAHAGRAANHQGYRDAEMGAVRALLRHLAVAVNTHRRACIDLDLAPEPHDIALWSTLEELRLPASDPRVEEGPSLAEQIVSGRWAAPEAVGSNG